MHWVVQAEVFSESNADVLLGTLCRAALPHSVVSIAKGESEPEQCPDLKGRVYVCGAQKLAKVALDQAWAPGSFLNENFEYGRWAEHLRDELLNPNASVTELKDLVITADTFVRPAEDSKVFDGQVFTADGLEALKLANPDLHETQVLASLPTPIWCEYRLFIVRGTVVTGSQYRRAGQVYLSPDVDPEVRAYAESVIDRWEPAEAFVLDVALTPTGCKVIEFNNINSSGFYASDVARYVEAIEVAFG